MMTEKSLELQQSFQNSLTGVDLHIAAVFQDEYITKQLNIEFLKYLKVFLNFTYVLIEAENWGSYNETTDTWDGMISLLQSGEADYAISTSRDIPERREVVDFTMATSSYTYTAFFLKPSIARDTMALVRPFGTNLWWAILVTLLVLILVLSVENPQEFGKQHQALRWNTEYSLFAVSTMCKITFGVAIKARWPVMGAVLATSVMSVVVVAAYSGTLLSFLFVKEAPHSNLSSIQSRPYIFAVDSQLNLFDDIVKAPPSSLRSNFITRPKIALDASKGWNFMNVLEGRWVVIVDSWVTKNELLIQATPEQICSIMMEELPLVKQNLGGMLPKGSPYKRSIDYTTLKAMETGLNSLWMTREAPKESTCDVIASFEPVSIPSLLAAVYLYGTGLGCAVVLLVLEKLAMYALTAA